MAEDDAHRGAGDYGRYGSDEIFHGAGGAWPAAVFRRRRQPDSRWISREAADFSGAGGAGGGASESVSAERARAVRVPGITQHALHFMPDTAGEHDAVGRDAGA